MKFKKLILILVCTLFITLPYDSLYTVHALEEEAIVSENEEDETQESETVEETEDTEAQEDTSEEIYEEEAEEESGDITIEEESEDESNEEDDSSLAGTTDEDSSDEDEDDEREVVDGYVVINLSEEELKADDTSAVIQVALDEAYENATDDLPYKIIIEEGSYSLTSSLYVSSNTYLYAQGCTFTQDYELDTNAEDHNSFTLIKIAYNQTEAESVVGYYYKNITIDGGYWDKNSSIKTGIIIAHATNVTVKNATFTNSYNAHLMEIAGSDGVTVSNCVFSNQTLSLTATLKCYEAIQLDILEDERLLGYNCEDLPLKNVLITDCTFDNVVRGVGNHAAVLNNPYDSVTITNNTFTNVSSCAIQLMNGINTVVTNNTITAPRGIYIYTYRGYGCFYGYTIANQGTTKSSSTPTYYMTPTDSNITISNNNITRSGSDDYATYTESGIYISGYVAVSGYEPTSGDTLPTGNYYLVGVTVNSNTITSDKYGIVVEDVYDSSITNNTMKGTSTTYSGIEVFGSSNDDTFTSNVISGFSQGINVYDTCDLDTISSNTISNSSENGIYITNSSVTTIASNTIKATKNYGIKVYNGAKITNLKSNKISNTKWSGICLSTKASVTNITKNTISSSKVNGIYLCKSSTSSSIKSNTITSSSNYGIYLNKSTGTTIKSNTITSSGNYSVMVYNSSTSSSVSSNTITKGSKLGIMVKNSTVKSVNSNTISSCKGSGIYLNGSKVTNIKTNTITSPKSYGICAYNSTVTTIDSNEITKPTKYGIAVRASSKVTTISNNTINNGSSRGISITSAKKDMSVKSNTIYQCKGYSIYTNPNSTTYRISIKSNKITGLSKKYRGIYCKTGKVTIMSNTIKSCKYPVQVLKAVKANIYKNTLSSNTINKYRISSTNYSNLSTPTLSISTKTKNSIKLKWTKTSGTGYKVYRSKSESGTYSLVKTISKSSTLTYTNNKLSSKTTYYYKVRTYRKVGNTCIYGSYSSVKSGTTK